MLPGVLVARTLGSVVACSFFVSSGIAQSGSYLTAYSRQLADSPSDFVAGIAIDSQGCAYIAGTTWSTNFAGATNPRHGTHDNADVFVVKLDPASPAHSQRFYRIKSGPAITLRRAGKIISARARGKSAANRLCCR
jgi:Beta-propeller repeat